MNTSNGTTRPLTDRVVNTRFTESAYAQIVEIAERRDRTVSYMVRKWVGEALAADAAEQAAKEAV